MGHGERTPLSPPEMGRLGTKHDGVAGVHECTVGRPLRFKLDSALFGWLSSIWYRDKKSEVVVSGIGWGVPF